MFDANTSTARTFEELDFDIIGKLVMPGDPEWNAARSAWNLAADQQPRAVIFVANASDVRMVLRFAMEENLQVTAQSTGHLAMAMATADLANTILIRTTSMTDITVDEVARVVRVGAGATWGPVSAALAPFGLVALAGSSHDVGVVGYTLGGGCSWLARSLGLASSAVTAVEIALANGDAVRATATNNSDLFWAVRGGGGNFGIVTALEFCVFPINDVYAGMLLFPVDRAREVLDEYAAWTAQLDERATTCARILRFAPLPELPEFIRGQSFVGIDGAINASDAEAQSLLQPLRAMGAAIDTFARVPSSSLAELHMDPPSPVPAIGDGIAITVLNSDVIDALLASTAGDASSPLTIVDIRHLGGAVGRSDPSGGAVDHLNGEFLVYAAGIVPSVDAVPAVTAAVASVRQSLSPWASDQTCSNFRELFVEPIQLWDVAVLERLRAIKLTRDPTNTIRGAHLLQTEPTLTP